MSVVGGLGTVLALDVDPWVSGTREALDSFMDLGDGIASVMGSIGNVVTTTISALRGVGSEAASMVSTVTAAFSQLPLFGVERGFGDLSGLLGGGATAMAGIVDGMGGLGQAAASAFASGFGGALSGAFAGMEALFRGVFDTVIRAAAGAFIGGTIGAILGPAGSVGGALLGGLLALATGVVNTISNMTTGIAGGILTGITGIIDAGAKGIQAIGEMAQSVIKGMTETTKVALDIVMETTAFMSQQASDFIEEANKFNVAFRDFGRGVNDGLVAFGETVGRSQLALMDFAGTAQSTFMTLGLSRLEAARFSTEVTKLAVDLGSFFNVADSKAFQALESGIMGNHRALRQFGIGINATTLGTELMALGFQQDAKSALDAVHSATEYEKVLARLSIILRQTVEIQGDAERTAMSFANTIKRVEAMALDLASAFGQELNAKLAEFINAHGGMAKIEQVLAAVFLISRDISVAMAEAATNFIDWAYTGFEAVGGLQGVLAGFYATIEEGQRAMNIGWEKAKLAFNLMGPMFTSIRYMGEEAFKGLVAGVDWMAAKAEIAFLRIKQVASAVLTAYVVFHPGAARAAAAEVQAAGLGVTGTAQQIAEAQARANVAWEEMTFRVDNVGKELKAFGEYGATAFRLLMDNAATAKTTFSEAGSAIEAAVLGYTDRIYDSVAAVAAAESATIDYAAISIKAAQEVATAWERVGNIFQSLQRAGAIPAAGTSALDNFGPGNQGPRDTFPGDNDSMGTDESAYPGMRGPTLDAPASTGYAVGTGYVPRDMVMRVHRGETIVPPHVAAANRPALQDMLGGRRMGRGGDTFNIVLPNVTQINPDTVETQIMPAAQRARRRGAR